MKNNRSGQKKTMCGAKLIRQNMRARIESCVSINLLITSRSLPQVPIPRTGASVGFGRTTTAHRLLSPLGWRERGCKEKNSCGAPTFSLGQQTSSFEPLGVSTKESGGPSILMLASPNPNSLLTPHPPSCSLHMETRLYSNWSGPRKHMRHQRRPLPLTAGGHCWLAVWGL